MTLCARCGSASPVGSAACVSCGNPLTTPAQGAPKGQFKQTVLGAGPPSMNNAPAPLQKTQVSQSAPPGASPKPAGAPAASQQRAFGGTMIGGVQQAPPPKQGLPAVGAPPATQQSPRAFGGTMIGGVQGGPPPPMTSAAPAAGAVPPQAEFSGTMAGGISAPKIAEAPPAPDFGGTLSGGVAAPGRNAPAGGAAPPGTTPSVASPSGQPAPQPSAAPQGGAPRAFAGTMVGVAGPGGPMPGAPPPQGGGVPGLRGTQPGGTPQASGSPQPGSAAGGGGFKQTMVAGGFGGGSTPSANPAQGGPPPPGGLQGGAAGAFTGPAITGASSSGAQTMLHSSPGTSAPVARKLEAAPPRPEQKRTMVGSVPSGIPPAAGLQPGAPVALSPVRVEVTDSRRPPRRQPPPRVPKGAWVLIAAAAVLAIAGVLFAIAYEPPAPMAAKVSVTEDGSELLHLICDDCPDGTVVRHGKASAEMKGGKAEFALEDALAVGTSELEVSVERPGMGRDEKVKLPVYVAYRIRGDFSGLDDDPPELRVAVDAQKGAAVLVDGKAIKLDAQGHGTYALDVGSELVGAKDVVVPLERKVPYSITPPGGETSKGEVTVRIGIAPLRVDAPGESIVIASEHFMLTGRTANEGVLTVSGRPITVDASGRFSQLMNVSSVGHTNIVVKASAKDHAPRTMTISVKRVESLETEGEIFEQRAKADYSEYRDAEAAKGAEVVVDGRVMNARVDGHTTLAIVDVTEGCDDAPCLAKIVHGAKLSLAKDDEVKAYGRVLRMVDGPRSNLKIPEIRAEFVRKD